MSDPSVASQKLLTLSAEHALRSLLPSNAVFLAERLCAQHPSEASWTLLARAHLATGSYARASRAISKIAQVPNASAEARYMYAALLIETPGENSMAEAEAVLRGQHYCEPETSMSSAARQVPGGAAGLYLLGLICQRTARRDEAKQFYRKALSLNPTLWVAAEALAGMGAVSSSSALLGTYSDDEVIAMLAEQPQFDLASSALYDDREADVLRISGSQNFQQDVCYASTPPMKNENAQVQSGRTSEADDSLPPAPPTTPAQSVPRRFRARFTTPSPATNSTPAVPGAPGKRQNDGRRSARLLSPDVREASAVSRMLGVGSTPQQNSQHSRKAQPQSRPTVQHQQPSVHPQQSRYPQQMSVTAIHSRLKQDCHLDPRSQEKSAARDALVRHKHERREMGMDVIRLFVQIVGSLGQYKCAAAIRHSLQLPRCHLDDSFTHALVGRAHLELGDYIAAEEAFRTSLKIEPARLNGVVEYLSTAMWHLKKETELAEVAVHSFSVDRQAPATWCSIGNCFSSQRDPDTALRYFKRAVRLDPYNAYAHTLAGHEYVIKEDFDSALASYRQALNIDERHYNALYGIGQVLQKQEKFALAERHYRAALRAHPRNSNLHYHLGVSLAAAAAATASANNNNAADAGRAQGASLLVLALKELELAAILDPKNPVSKFERARVLVQMNRVEDARAQLEGLRDALPREAAVYYELGNVCKRMHDTCAALRYFNNALEIDPKDQGRKYKKAIDGLCGSPTAGQ